MKHLYYLLNELIKSYHVFARFDRVKAAEILQKINAYRLQIALIAEQRQIFYSQLTAEQNVSGYRNDIPFTRDDLASLIIRVVAFLEQDVTITLTQLGRREQLFTRQAIQWQQLFSDVQSNAPARGQQIPFDFTQEIFLDKDEALSFGISNQNGGDGFLFIHGCNLKDDYAPNREEIEMEINETDDAGIVRLPELQIIPIQYRFTAAAAGNPAVAADGGDAIYSIKSDRSVILTDVSTNAIRNRISLLDTGRNQEIANEIEMLGIAGNFTSPLTVYYPLPYPHLLRRQSRIKFRALNGSIITGTNEAANTIFTLSFRGFTI